MLSRSAQGLYWLGRYLERAEHLCRLLQLQTEALVDRPIQEIYYGWSRIYRCIGTQPAGGLFDPEGDDDYTLADSYTLADEADLRAFQPRLGVELLRTGARERPPDAALHQRGDVDVAERAVSAAARVGHTKHLGHISGGLLRADRRGREHLHRRVRRDDVPRRGLAVLAAWPVRGTLSAFGVAAAGADGPGHSPTWSTPTPVGAGCCGFTTHRRYT